MTAKKEEKKKKDDPAGTGDDSPKVDPPKVDPPKVDPPKNPVGRPKKEKIPTVSLKVLQGTFVSGGKDYLPGDIFELNKRDAEYLLREYPEGVKKV